MSFALPLFWNAYAQEHGKEQQTMKRLTAILLTMLLTMSAAWAETIEPKTVEVWYGRFFGAPITLTLMDDGTYEEKSDWYGFGNWERDEAGNLTLRREETVLQLQKTEEGMLGTLTGTDSVQFLLTSTPADAEKMPLDINREATLNDLQGEWTSIACFVQSLCLPADAVGATQRIWISGTTLRHQAEKYANGTANMYFGQGVLSGIYAETGRAVQAALLEDGRLLLLTKWEPFEKDDGLDVYFIMQRKEKIICEEMQLGATKTTFDASNR